MKKTDPKLKEGFIKVLSSLSPEEINKIIEEKGQEIKPIPLIVRY